MVKVCSQSLISMRARTSCSLKILLRKHSPVFYAVDKMQLCTGVVHSFKLNIYFDNDKNRLSCILIVYRVHNLLRTFRQTEITASECIDNIL